MKNYKFSPIDFKKSLDLYISGVAKKYEISYHIYEDHPSKPLRIRIVEKRTVEFVKQLYVTEFKKISYTFLSYSWPNATVDCTVTTPSKHTINIIDFFVKNIPEDTTITFIVTQEQKDGVVSGSFLKDIDKIIFVDSQTVGKSDQVIFVRPGNYLMKYEM